jgi:hypothetical protein
VIVYKDGGKFNNQPAGGDAKSTLNYLYLVTEKNGKHLDSLLIFYSERDPVLSRRQYFFIDKQKNIHVYRFQVDEEETSLLETKTYKIGPGQSQLRLPTCPGGKVFIRSKLRVTRRPQALQAPRGPSISATTLFRSAPSLSTIQFYVTARIGPLSMAETSNFIMMGTTVPAGTPARILLLKKSRANFMRRVRLGKLMWDSGLNCP